MRVIHIIEGFSAGDGVCGCAITLAKFLNKNNIENEIATFNTSYYPENVTLNEYDCFEDIVINEEDIVLYSFCYGSQLNYKIETLHRKKILIYQNVTPAEYFRGINNCEYLATLQGVNDSLYTAGNYLKCITMSEFSKSNLLSAGWQAEDVLVAPLFKQDGTEVEPDIDVLTKYKDGKKNILFVGRVVRNKKQEDLLKIYKYFCDNYNSNTRLILAGSIGEKVYVDALKNLERLLQCNDVVFTGHISQEELEAYYNIADVFVCMSEHEGLCLPIIEAMKSQIPVVAYNSTALPDTMGAAGVLVDTKDEKIVCDIISKLFNNEEYRNNIINGQSARIKEYNVNAFENDIINLLYEVDNMDNYVYKFENDSFALTFDSKWIRCGEKIIFKNDDNWLNYVIKGMSHYDGYTAWTNAKEVIYRFDILGYNKKDIIFNMKAMVYKTQKVTVIINDNVLYTSTLSGEQDINININNIIANKGKLIIKILLPDAMSPHQDDEKNPDERMIALGISEIVFNCI